MDEQIAYVKADGEVRDLGPVETIVAKALIEHDAVMNRDLIDDNGEGEYWRWLEETDETDFSYHDAARIAVKALRQAGYTMVPPIDLDDYPEA